MEKSTLILVNPGNNGFMVFKDTTRHKRYLRSTENLDMFKSVYSTSIQGVELLQKLLVISILIHCTVQQYLNYEAYDPFDVGNHTYYSSAFEEANATFDDYKSQAIMIYQIYCHQGCAMDTEMLRNKFCGTCYCDFTCSYYGDCCPDYNDVDHTKRINWSCQSKSVPQRGDNFPMVNSCPEQKSNQELVEQCQEVSEDNWRFNQPVSDKTTGLTYRNTYCAQCHGVDGFRWSAGTICRSGPPKIEPQATKDKVYQSIINYPDCNVLFLIPDNITERRCTDMVADIVSCNATGQWNSYDSLIEKGCNTLPENRVRNYKNLFCYMCNTYYTWQDIKTDYLGYNPNVFRIALSALLDIDDEADDTRDEKYCPFRDPYQCICRNLSCSENKKYDNGTCKSVYTRTNSFIYNMCLKLLLTLNSTMVSVNVTLSIVDLIVDGITDMNGVVGLLHFGLEYLDDCAPVITMEAKLYVRIFFREPVDVDEFERQLLAFILTLSNSSKKGVDIELSFTGVCDNHGMTDTPLIVNSDFTVPCPEYNVSPFFVSLYKSSDMHIMFRGVNINFSKIYSCPNVLLSSSEAQLSQGNDSLLIKATNTTIGAGYFGWNDDGFLICLDDYLTKDEYILHDASCENVPDVPNYSTLGIVSGICTSLSLLFLVITFVIFCILKSLRTMVGIGIMALILSLIFAQTLFEFGAEQVDIKWVCQSLGILTHFFWLSSTFWMNVCTVILFYKLNYPIHSRHISTRKMLLVFIPYSCGGPAIIILVVVVSSHFISGTLGYGGSSCYITEASGRRYAFALPVGILVLVNIFLFFFTFMKLNRNQKLQSNQEHSIGMFACLKLSVITGLTWTFAFLFEATLNEVFAYLFTVFVGSQGFVLFLAFIVNKRVFTMLMLGLTRSKQHQNKSSRNKSKPNSSSPSSSSKSKADKNKTCTSSFKNGSSDSNDDNNLTTGSQDERNLFGANGEQIASEVL